MSGNQSDVTVSRQIMAVLLHLGHRLLSRRSCARFHEQARGGEIMQPKRLVLIAALMTVAVAAAAKEKPAPSPLVSAIDRCRQIADPMQRLACYDAAAGALVQATNSGAVAVVDENEVKKVRHSLFGFSLPKIPFFSGDTT